MNTALPSLLAGRCALAAVAAFVCALPLRAELKQPWQVLTNPTAAEAARGFASPAPEYSPQFTWGWQGPVDREVIARDLDGMKSIGVLAAAIEPKTGMAHPYLSPEYFDLVRVAIQEAKQRGMRLWIMDDGDYPSGLAGGKFSIERPDLRMKALLPTERIAVMNGTTITRDLSREFICAVATNKADGATAVIEPKGNRLEWTAPASGDWEMSLVRWTYRTLPTRSANNPANVKDTSHSLMDFLAPEAGRLFEEWTFDQYQKTIGDELGRTVLGFRGDEPAFVPNPWTPAMLQEFSQRKGYDLRPYLAALSAGPAPRATALTEEQRRVYADYSDVWSDLFDRNYFQREAVWAAAHGVEIQMHVEHEEILPQLAVADGDIFKNLRHVQVPGVDIIWHQLWMDNPAEFPKLASSIAHVYGHPRAMCEAFAAYRPAPDLKQARWLLDFLFSRGISRIEYMFWPASVPRGGAGVTSAPAAPTTAQAPAPAAKQVGGYERYYRDPGFPVVAAYSHRLSYLLGEGRPMAQIGLYLPSSSFWLSDPEQGKRTNEALLAIAHQLMTQQRDFDFVDDNALVSVLKPQGDGLVNLSGQAYRAILIPPCAAIPQQAVGRLRAFVKAGGRVVVLGDRAPLQIGRTFRDATTRADFTWATLRQTEPAMTARVLAALGTPDVALDRPAPLVSYTHRQLRDAEVYFVFNSGDDAFDGSLTLAGTGAAEVWDATTGTTRPLAGATAKDGRTTVPVRMPGWSTVIITLRRDA